MSRFLRLPPVTLTLLAACVGAAPDDRRTGVVVEDSAGITIIDNGPFPPPEAGDPPTPVVAMGVVDGAPEYQLFQIGDVKRLSDGAIAVANAGTRELRIDEPEGTQRATAGGAAQGPGEFRYSSALVVLPGDMIQVQDRLDRV